MINNYKPIYICVSNNEANEFFNNIIVSSKNIWHVEM